MTGGGSGYHGRVMHRRRFLALAGAAGAAGAAGLAGTVASRAEAAENPTIVAARGPGDIDQASFPQRGHHRVIWSVAVTDPVAAITFDDGPDPAYTPRILEALDAAGVHATFFMMGHCVQRWPDLAREVVARGHEIANHTWTHLNLSFESPERTEEEMVRGTQLIEDTLGVRCRYFRPPRGQLTGSTIRYAADLGQDTVIWSVTRGVHGTGTPEAVASHVRRFLGPGDVLILHDGVGRAYFDPDAPFAQVNRDRREVEVRALPQMLEEAADRGLILGTVSDVLAVEAPGRPQPEPEP